MEKKNSYLTTFEKIEKSLSGGSLQWVKQARQSALAQFIELGFPTTKNEEWRFTNVDPIAKTAFNLAETGPNKDLKLQNIEQNALSSFSSCQLSFVNGRYAPEYSSVPNLKNGVVISSLAASLKTEPEKIKGHLTRYADLNDHSFTALNTAFFSDGAFIYLPKDTALQLPIHLLFLSVPGVRPSVSYPRILILAEPGSKASVIETYAGLKKGTYWTNSVTELIVGEHSTVSHYKIQIENKEAYHMGRIQAEQDRNSIFSSCSISLGAALARNDIRSVLKAEGADCALNGLYMVSGQQHVDHQTTIDHAQPHCTSRELYKGILDDKARAVFNGKIVVRPNAQKTDATQTNKNLLLSNHGLIHTKPELKIFANDVKCKHGATIGQLDPDALFYLRSRGIDQKKARELLIHAFANEVIDSIETEPIRLSLNRILSRRLSEKEKP